MKNKLTDLNNHLFEQLERLNDDDLKGSELEEELKRTKGIVTVASQIISNADVMLQAQKHMDEYGYEGRNKSMNPILISTGEKFES